MATRIAPLRAAGFTLIEVMVALAIFALVSVTLVKSTGQSLRQTALIEQKATAWWLAENAMTRLRIQPRTDANYPNPGTQRELVTLASVDWEVETRIEATENDFVRRIEINIYHRGETDDPAASLVGFLGRH